LWWAVNKLLYGRREQYIFLTHLVGCTKNTQVGYLKGISPVAVIVTKNRVMIFNYESHISCLAITNDEIAESFKGFFESLWSLAEKE